MSCGFSCPFPRDSLPALRISSVPAPARTALIPGPRPCRADSGEERDGSSSSAMLRCSAWYNSGQTQAQARPPCSTLCRGCPRACCQQGRPRSSAHVCPGPSLISCSGSCSCCSLPFSQPCPQCMTSQGRGGSGESAAQPVKTSLITSLTTWRH